MMAYKNILEKYRVTSWQFFDLFLLITTFNFIKNFINNFIKNNNISFIM